MVSVKLHPCSQAWLWYAHMSACLPRRSCCEKPRTCRRNSAEIRLNLWRMLLFAVARVFLVMCMPVARSPQAVLSFGSTLHGTVDHEIDQYHTSSDALRLNLDGYGSFDGVLEAPGAQFPPVAAALVFFSSSNYLPTCCLSSADCWLFPQSL